MGIHPTPRPPTSDPDPASAPVFTVESPLGVEHLPPPSSPRLREMTSLSDLEPASPGAATPCEPPPGMSPARRGEEDGGYDDPFSSRRGNLGMCVAHRMPAQQSALHLSPRAPLPLLPMHTRTRAPLWPSALVYG